MTRLDIFLLLSLAFATAPVQCQISNWIHSLKANPSSQTKSANENDAFSRNSNSLRSSGARGAGKIGSLEQRRETRLLMGDGRGMNNNKGGNGNNGNGNNNGNSNSNNLNGGRENANGLIEPPPGICLGWELAGTQDRANSAMTDDACKTNSCDGGCCRVYNWLICDTSNTFEHLVSVVIVLLASQSYQSR